MGRSKETYGKKEVRKKQEKKRKDKEARKQARKEGGKTEDQDMFAYVDQFGNILSEPPDNSQKEDINPEDIEVSVPKGSGQNPEDKIKVGTVTFYNAQKGYGFIREQETKQSFFVHANDIDGEIAEGNRVNFEIGSGPRGPVAVDVKISK